MSTRTIDGLTPTQLTWMQSDYTAAKALGKTHTFIFTHGPIVGHGGLATHDDAYLRQVVGEYPHWVTTVDRDLPFVEWVNGAGMTVEAVFCGHTHMTIGYGDAPPYKITADNMDNPRTFNTNDCVVPYSWHTVYIETDTACKKYP